MNGGNDDGAGVLLAAAGTRVPDGLAGELAALGHVVGSLQAPPSRLVAGVLVVNGDISTSSLVTVMDGASLQGTGTVGSMVVDDAGHVAPGNSIGTLTVSGSMTILPIIAL